MPGPKKKRITPENVVSASESSSPPLPEQQEFHQHLRRLAQSAVRTVLELVMREELDAFIGVAWGEWSPQRKGYRNGHYTRDLVTSMGRLEDIKVPRDREGHFRTRRARTGRSGVGSGMALGWHGSMSGEPQADGEPFLAWWSVVPSASSRLSSPESRASLPRISTPGIISGGATCGRTCSSVRKPAGDSFASAKIRPPIWRFRSSLRLSSL